MVINADSSQVYADLQVLSARPSTDEMGEIEHRLFGTWDGAQACSAAEWASAAAAQIASVQAEGGIPILVGGTGLYMRTLLDGIAPVPAIDDHVRSIVRALPVAEAYAALTREDPERAALLASNDSARISRALEVVRSTGRSLADWQARKEGGIGATVTLRAAILLPQRDLLYSRCNQRFARMVGRGAVDEVAALLTRDLDPALPVMRAIGVPQLAAYLRREISLEVAAAQATQATRNYAKRQFTWFHHQPPPEWSRLMLEPVSDVSDILLRSFALT